MPGLAARVLHPALEKPEFAVPTLIVELLPTIILGFVVCGLLASQMSTIDSNLGATATLFTHDIYTRIFKRKATTREILRVVRVATIGAGIIMIAVSYLVPKMGGTVDAYLTIISIMDMPLFVIAVVYGLLWKRATWQGAIIGYLSGAAVGTLLRFGFQYEVSMVTFASGGIALLMCPLVSFFTMPTDEGKLKLVFDAKKAGAEELQQGEIYNIIPSSTNGKLSLFIFGMGLVIFFIGVLMGSRGLSMASITAVVGMVIYFIGGYLRTRFD
jgi:Na+/proline symporter